MSYQSCFVSEPQTWADACGSIWSTDSSKLLGELGYYLASQLSVLSQRQQQTFTSSSSPHLPTEVFSRVGLVEFRKPVFEVGEGRSVGVLPDWVLRVSHFQSGERTYFEGPDYVQVGNALLFSPHVRLLGTLEVIGHSVVGTTWEFERLWGTILGYTDFKPGAGRFIRAIIDAGKRGFIRETYGELVAAATGTHCVKLAGTVTDIIYNTDLPTPMVVTTAETVLGSPGDTAVVSIGDAVYPGDFVFDGVRTWDCNEPPPSFISELKIWPEYFSFPASGPIIVSGLPAPATFVNSGGKVRTRFPLGGEVADVAGFFAAQDAREDQTGISFIQAITGQSNPIPASVTQNFNWIEVLWETWLRYGAVVTYIASSQPVSPEVQFKLRAIERAVPPWITHLVQYVPNRSSC